VLDTRAIEVFLKSPDEYLREYRYFVKRYLHVWGEVDLYQIRRKWKVKGFSRRIETALNLLKENYVSFSDRFYDRFSLKVYRFRFMPVVGFDSSYGWADVESGDVVVYFPLETVDNSRSLILNFFYLYPQGYMMKRNSSFVPSGKMDFFCMGRVVPLYGMAVSMCTRGTYGDDTLCIRRHNRVVDRIWMGSMESSLGSYTKRLLADMDVCAPVLFREWFGNKKGLYVSYRFLEFLLDTYPLDKLMDMDRMFFRYQMELYGETIQ